MSRHLMKCQKVDVDKLQRSSQIQDSMYCRYTEETGAEPSRTPVHARENDGRPRIARSPACSVHFGLAHGQDCWCQSRLDNLFWMPKQIRLQGVIHPELGLLSTLRIS